MKAPHHYAKQRADGFSLAHHEAKPRVGFVQHESNGFSLVETHSRERAVIDLAKSIAPDPASVLVALLRGIEIKLDGSVGPAAHCAKSSLHSLLFWR